MSDRMFGTDGIRGVANMAPMTVETVLKVGRAAGYLYQQEARRHTILIGKDTRISGYMVENALTAGLCSMGGNVSSGKCRTCNRVGGKGCRSIPY